MAKRHQPVSTEKGFKGNGEIPEDVPLFGFLLPNEVDVEKAFGVEFGQFQDLNVYCPFCEKEGVSTTPSCSVNIDGMWHCKSCQRKGDAVKFYTQRCKVPIQQAKSDLNVPPGKVGKRAKAKKVRPVTEDLVAKCHNVLMRSTLELAYLTGTRRGLDIEILKAYEIGCDERRMTIPVRQRNGELWGIRRYLANGDKKKPKLVSHQGGKGEPHLYPAQNLDRYAASEAEYIVLCEGEWDCLAAIQHGFDATTVTSGVQTWTNFFTLELLTVAKPVVIIYDVNDRPDELGRPDLGQRVARRRACELRDAGLTVKVVRLPIKKEGGDLTDWFTECRKTGKELAQLIEETEVYTAEPEPDEAPEPSQTVYQTEGGGPLVTLNNAALSDYFYKAIKLRCVVAGKTNAPYFLPKKVQVDITDEQGGIETRHHEFDAYDGQLLSLIKCTTNTQHNFIKTALGVPKGLNATVTVLEALNVQEIFLTPAIDHERDQGPYTLRQAYYVGHGLQTNQVYEFEGYTLPDPRTQAATHVLTSAKLAQTDLESFELTDDLYQQLRATFQTSETVDVFAKLDQIAGQFAKHVSRIYGRPDLHTAIDLVFHSPLSFYFDGTRLRKGWLECLVIGDTRTGKGFVGEGLVRHYGVGEVVSAEGLTKAGLIGGIQKVGDHLMLTWGKIPLADGRILLMDECSSLGYDTISEMSRIRSEGVIEITKIITEKTSARTRLVWMANPRSQTMGKPKKMAEFTYGIQAVPELIGNVEDVARFDYVVTVAHGEVKSDVINRSKRVEDDDIEDLIYSSELCRKLIVWVWSRKADQVIFSPEVVDHVMTAAKDIGGKFSSTICLIQPEDVRFKIARIAAAAAGRTFSTDDGENLIVRTEHVDFAYNFLFHIYSKSSCGYAQLSATERERSTLRDPKAVLECLQQVGDLFPDLVSGLLEQSQISARDMVDYAGVDIFQARNIISELVRLRAITKDYNYYTKKPSFKGFLQHLKSQLIRDPHHVTVADDEDFVVEVPSDEE